MTLNTGPRPLNCKCCPAVPLPRGEYCGFGEILKNRISVENRILVKTGLNSSTTPSIQRITRKVQHVCGTLFMCCIYFSCICLFVCCFIGWVNFKKRGPWGLWTRDQFLVSLYIATVVLQCLCQEGNFVVLVKYFKTGFQLRTGFRWKLVWTPRPLPPFKE